MIWGARHLNDDRLHESYLAERSGEPVDPRTAEHLADCQSCRARYAELAHFLNGVRTEAMAEADEMFSPAQFRQQQEQILRRIEHLSHAARVISFPGHVGHRIESGTGRIAPRWLAAAAAAGLLVGVVVGGRVLPGGTRERATTMTVAGTPAEGRVISAPAVLIAEPAAADDAFDDDDFLRELEIALDRPHTQELQPFDALTPLLREIDNPVR